MTRKQQHKNHRVSSSHSLSSVDSGSLSGKHTKSTKSGTSHQIDNSLPPPVLVYHASARSIVFRDHIRRAVKDHENDATTALESALQEKYSSEAATQLDAPNDKSGQKAQDAPQPDNKDNLLNAAGVNEDVLISSKGSVFPVSQIEGFQPRIVALPRLGLGPNDEYEKFRQLPSPEQEKEWTLAEQEVVQLLRTQQAAVKTIKNGSDWTSFLRRFTHPKPSHSRAPSAHDDHPPSEADHPDLRYNSFVTSTTLLPAEGKKMRCFGSRSQYTVGAVFALPHFDDPELETEAARQTQTWSWPSGYSAKTEFNIDSNGRLINGRQEALCPLPLLRQYNYEYLHCEEYTVAMRRVSGLSQVPYNELFLRVGGLGRLVNGKDVVTGNEQNRSFENGVGLPIALFIRSATFGDLIAMLRTRARMMHTFGENMMKNIPLLLVSPTDGVRVLTDALQKELWKIMASQLNPFQNPSLAHVTTITRTEEEAFHEKVDELLDLDDDLRELLTPEELSKLAGGFGATDESVAKFLKDIMIEDHKSSSTGQRSYRLQEVVNEGLASAIRSGDYHTSRQLLILYSLVASRPINSLDNNELNDKERDLQSSEHDKLESNELKDNRKTKYETSLGRDVKDLQKEMEALTKHQTGDLSTNRMLAPPPPPPLDTDRLRSATNSDGLLAVLGAAQVLKAMQDGSAKRRVQESISAVEEWVDHGEQSMAFRLSSWRDQRAAQGDLQIAIQDPTNWMAFVSQKAVTNRKNFAQQLREAASRTDFNDVRFLRAISEMLSKMRSPCLRLELLQYVLGLDNRYSVAHVARSVELAATCLGISSQP